MQGGISSPDPWWQGSINEQKTEVVSLAQLFSFFQNPQKYFVQHILGIRLDRSVSSLEEHEPFALDSLQKYLLEQDLISGRLRGRESNHLRQQAQAAGQWMLGTPGEIGFEKTQEEQQTFLARLMEQEDKEREDDRFVDVQLDGLRLSGQLGFLYENGFFLFRYANLKAKDIMTVWLYHCLSSVCCDQPRDTRLLAKDCELLFAAGSASRKDLQQLLSIFLQGQQTPSILLLEPALVYARQREKFEETGRGDPLEKAVSSFKRSMEKGFEAEWDLLYQGQSIENLFGSEFVEMADWFYESIWKRADVREL